jgi:hypothetical protein
MRELALSGRQFTWANRREIPTFEYLDRILVSVEWEQKYPLSTVQALTRSRSDQTPLLLDSGDHAFLGNKANFSFELSWLKQEGLRDIVAREWVSVPSEVSPMVTWQNKLHHLCHFLRGWARDQSGKYKLEKERLSNIIYFFRRKGGSGIFR